MFLGKLPCNHINSFTCAYNFFMHILKCETSVLCYTIQWLLLVILCVYGVFSFAMTLPVHFLFWRMLYSFVGSIIIAGHLCYMEVVSKLKLHVA